MQFLFGLDFSQAPWQTALDAFWEAQPARPGVKRYAREVIQGVCRDLEIIDAAIADAVHHWTPDRVGRVERAILRIAFYEMRHVDDVPVNVAINEAVEIAKRYGSDEAPRFVNGVLDRLKDVPKSQTG